MSAENKKDNTNKKDNISFFMKYVLPSGIVFLAMGALLYFCYPNFRSNADTETRIDELTSEIKTLRHTTDSIRELMKERFPWDKDAEMISVGINNNLSANQVIKYNRKGLEFLAKNAVFLLTNKKDSRIPSVILTVKETLDKPDNAESDADICVHKSTAIMLGIDSLKQSRDGTFPMEARRLLVSKKYIFSNN